MTKMIRVEATWRSHYDMEVPDDWEWDGTLGAIIEIEDIDSSTAELVDWTVNGK